ncbi:hypothetical protein M9H77_16030 [Catharanthus roseus]|uniref:Uncharacterized protein n=1 Tax=Catharanthus roseus TaxID=4058 RepID=A0ACC0AYS0_CATRO|nr:hypothetical protein M9H77_16030 [Catharanthus roseus]
MHMSNALFLLIIHMMCALSISIAFNTQTLAVVAFNSSSPKTAAAAASSSFSTIEKVPAHVHLDPIVSDVLTRQHEHMSGLIWSGDHEICITDLQCRPFNRNMFQAYSTAPHRLIDIIDRTRYKVKKEPLEAWILREFTRSETDDDFIMRDRGIYFLTSWRSYACRAA